MTLPLWTMEPLWTSDDLVEATGGAVSHPFNATGVSIDSRTLQPGDLFVALIGDGRDGHRFVADAFVRGAAGAMVHAEASVDRPANVDALPGGGLPDGGLPGRGLPIGGLPVDARPDLPVLRVPVLRVPVLRVDDTLAGLARLGGFARARFGQSTPAGKLPAGKMVAVTGSAGKTTTKEMLRTTLAMFGSTHAAVASYNNHWGLPLTLARTPRHAEFCVAEIGMNHAGEIVPLARLARPHVAVITTIAAAHIGHLGSIEAIADEKASIVLGLEPGGVIVLPADSPHFARLLAAATAAGAPRVITFGTNPAADVRLLHIDADADGSLIHLAMFGRTLSLRLNAPGRHMAMNLAATLATVAALDLDPIDAIGALELFQPLAGRGVRRSLPVGRGTAILLDESYNGNSASMRAALDVLRLQPAKRRIAVLGDMLELGEAAAAEHADLAEAVAASADCLFTCGPLMRSLFDNVPLRLRGAHAADARDLAAVVPGHLANGDAILVKGSLGSQMRLVIEALDAAAARRS